VPLLLISRLPPVVVVVVLLLLLVGLRAAGLLAAGCWLLLAAGCWLLLVLLSSVNFCLGCGLPGLQGWAPGAGAAPAPRG
jgi:hypothetical protein